MHQAYLLAVQSNSISDYIQRFNSATVPAACQATVAAQLSKLKAVQTIIWNAMIALAAGSLVIDEDALKSLLEKQAGDQVALLEMEKLATAIAMDATPSWASEIGQVISNESQVPKLPAAENLDPVYDDPEGVELGLISSEPVQKNRQMILVSGNL